MRLKQYQVETLAILKRFFEEARIAGPKSAYERITSEDEQAARLRGFGGTYRLLNKLANVPYVCLRLPTGGGKTILAAHAVKIARDSWVEKDFPVVLWMVTSNTIRLQTVDALKNQQHPYRQALNEAFDGRVRVFDIADFVNIRPHDIRDQLCLVVGTIQTLRVKNTDGRKVYAHNENMEPHFSSVSPNTKGLERFTEGPNKGKIKFSFANLLHIHRPLMIVDEAHNAVTGLSEEMQARVNPCAIIEFTATPRPKSNTLHNVTAQELKREEMIKLPIMLSEHDNWQNAVNGAVNSRASLDESAKNESEYIRPIVLFQAQAKNQEVTVEVLKKHLIEVEQISEDRIAIATGAQRDLDGIDLFDKKCPIEYIITMEALKEGWDCSFAYVFCSVANIKSATDVEQLLGRVLRMPYAKRRRGDDLNKAYAHVAEMKFAEAARTLADKLIAMGFDEEEAMENIEPVQPTLGPDEDGLFGKQSRPKPIFSYKGKLSDDVIESLKNHHKDTVSVETDDTGAVEVKVSGAVSPSLEKEISDAIPEEERSGFSEKVERYRVDTKQLLSPAERGDIFIVPRLVANIQGELEFADTDILMEFHEWSLLDHPSRLGETEFGIRETARSFEIDLDGNKISYQFADEAEQLMLDIPVEGWTEENLALWLDRQVRQIDIDQGVMLKWLRQMVSNLTGPRELHIAALMRCKFILSRKVQEKISSFRQLERSKVYQQYLIAPDARVEVSFDDGFDFKENMYFDQRRYRGRYKFSKHFLGPDNVPIFDGEESGEEFQCAQIIDSLPDICYWLRNVARHPNSFWLPTAKGKFYPDFVALLNDGRYFIIEYKGAHIATGDGTNEKRTIGQLWEKSSAGKGLFLIVEKDVESLDMRGQILRKL